MSAVKTGRHKWGEQLANFSRLELLKVQLPICSFALATSGGPPATAGSPSSVEALAPKVIRYVGGVPVMSQDVVETMAFTETIKLADFFETEEASKLMLDDVDRATVMAAISRLQARLPVPQVSLMRGGEEKRMRVVADKCFEAGALLIAPFVQGISRLATRSAQAWELRATVSRSEDSEASTVFIVGGSTCPSMTAAALANAGSASSSSEAVSSHEWKASRFPWPFSGWFVVSTRRKMRIASWWIGESPQFLQWHPRRSGCSQTCLKACLGERFC